MVSNQVEIIKKNVILHTRQNLSCMQNDILHTRQNLSGKIGF